MNSQEQSPYLNSLIKFNFYVSSLCRTQASCFKQGCAYRLLFMEADVSLSVGFFLLEGTKKTVIVDAIDEEVSPEVARAKDQRSQLKAAKQTDQKATNLSGNLLFTSINDTEEKKVDGHLLKFTHLNKLYWPEDGITKRDMFNYYHQVAPLMVPYMKDRPMSLNRFLGGIYGESFYQKNVKDKAPAWATTMPHTNGDGVDKDYLLVMMKQHCFGWRHWVVLK
jgi:hypothetical protein